MKKEHLAIFDLDGTLFDTVPANYAAYACALQKCGVALSMEHFAAHCNGRYYKDFLSELLGEDWEKIEAVHRAKIAAYPQFFGDIRENKALFALLETLAPTYHIALVSTAARRCVYEILEHFGRKAQFELILTHAEIPHQKPAPDGFEMAMAHFGIAPEHTIIFEDSPEGIAAARASRASYFVVREIF